MEEKNSITLHDIFRVIVKNIIIIVLTVVLFTILGVIYAFVIKTPTYSARSQITVAVTYQVPSSETVDSTDTLRIVDTMAELTGTRTVIEPVVEEYNNAKEGDRFYKYHNEVSQISYYYIDGELSVSYTDTSYLFNVIITDKNGDLAVDLCNAIVESLINQVNTIEQLKVYQVSLYQASKAVDSVYASPNKTLLVTVSVLAGLVVALLIVFIKEFASTKFKTREEIEATINDKAICVFADNKENDKLKTVKLVEPSIRNYEPYNRLFTNIRYANLDNPYKVIMFSSTIDGELKSTITANLACCIAHNNFKVLVLDLDLRKPSVHRTFGVVREKGIVEYLDGSITKQYSIQHTSSNVDVISAGKNVINPFIVIDSPKLKNLINELRNEYDYILIDTPPLAICGDGKNISKLVDAVIYNVTINQVRKKMFADGVHQLKEVGANIIGYNITKLPLSKRDKENYYYYTYYKDYSDNTFDPLHISELERKAESEQNDVQEIKELNNSKVTYQEPEEEVIYEEVPEEVVYDNSDEEVIYEEEEVLDESQLSDLDGEVIEEVIYIDPEEEKTHHNS